MTTRPQTKATGRRGRDYVVRPGVDDIARRLELRSPEVARAVYEAIAGMPDGDEILRDLTGPTVTEEMVRLAKEIGPGVYQDAFKSGQHLDDYLADRAPAPRFSGADTFEHLLAYCEVDLLHDVRRGRRADTVGELREKGPEVGGGVHTGAVLLPELCNRAFRMGQLWGPSWLRIDRGELEYIERFYASTSILSDLLQPELLKQQMIQTPIREATLLNRLVAATEVLPPGTKTWEQFYVDTSDTEAYSYRRVPEGSTLPTVEILSGTGHTGRVYAYGRRVLFTYEVENWSLPLLQLHISLFALQHNKDEESVIVSDVLVNGDGNAGTAASVTNISTLNLVSAGSATEIPAQGILEYLNSLEATAHYIRHDLAIARGFAKTLIQISDFGDSNTRLFWGDMPSRAGQAVDAEALPHPPLFASSDAPSGQVMYVDGRQSVLRYIATGAPTVESDKIIARRMNEITFWTEWGHQRLIPNTVDILDYEN